MSPERPGPRAQAPRRLWERPRFGQCFRLVKTLVHPIRSTTQIWVVTCHQYGISAFVSQTSFGGETSCSFQISIWRISQLESDVLSFTLYVMLKFSNFILAARLRQTANANIYHVTKCLLYCLFAIYYLCT